MKKRGISLIVLIVTIIVIIILAAVVILTLSKNNPIESAKEASFKEDVRTFQDELAMAVSKEYANSGGHRDEKISTSDFDEIKEYIPSFNKKYEGKFVIKEDELLYTIKVTEKEKIYIYSLNIKKYLNYVQDSLILHLDGINNTRSGHSDTTTVWEDLSGHNNDFTKLSGAQNAIWSKNSFVGDAKNRTLVLNKAILKDEKECTVEVCYDVPRLQSYYWVFQNRIDNAPANGFQFVVSDTGRTVSTIRSHIFSSLSNKKIVTQLNKRTMGFAIDSDKVMFTDNANYYIDNSLEEIMNSICESSTYTIGSGYPWGGHLTFAGNIYSIRIYNRKLSEEELRNNYEVDKARFEME